MAESDPHGSPPRSLTLARVVHGLWGVADRSADEVVNEVAAAGYVDVVVNAGADAGGRHGGRHSALSGRPIPLRITTASGTLGALGLPHDDLP